MKSFLSAFLLACFLLSMQANAREYEVRSYHIISKSLVENFGASFGATSDNLPRSIKPLAPDMMKDFEGWEPGAYNDPIGYCTIGYGHLIAKKKCEHIDLGRFSKALDEQQGNDLFDQDTTWARTSVQDTVKVSLNDAQFGALVSFVFNVGESKFKDSTLLRLLNDGNYDLAARQFERWVIADKRILPGLVIRRACEKNLFLNTLIPDGNGKFTRSNCYSFGVATDSDPLIDINIGEHNDSK